MEDNDYIKIKGMIIGVISLVIPLIMILLILNWFFNITPYQKLEGLPLMITPFIAPVGIVLGFISLKVWSNKVAKWSVLINAILLIFPFIYLTLGTLIFGP